MALDNFTPTRVRALKDCPQGQRPGDEFIVTSDEADILIQWEFVERVTDPPKGTYKRRDLVAEKTR